MRSRGKAGPDACGASASVSLHKAGPDVRRRSVCAASPPRASSSSTRFCTQNRRTRSRACARVASPPRASSFSTRFCTQNRRARSRACARVASPPRACPPGPGARNSRTASHPATRLLPVFVSGTPFSKNSSAALFPVSCLRFHRSGGASQACTSSPPFTSSSRRAAALMICPWPFSPFPLSRPSYSSRYTTARPCSSTATQSAASMSMP